MRWLAVQAASGVHFLTDSNSLFLLILFTWRFTARHSSVSRGETQEKWDVSLKEVVQL